jgi:hypothetical protein
VDIYTSGGGLSKVFNPCLFLPFEGEVAGWIGTWVCPGNFENDFEVKI